jgi:hypothetical protein
MAALYPEVLSLNNSYPWLGTYDRRVGPLALDMEQQGLLASGERVNPSPAELGGMDGHGSKCETADQVNILSVSIVMGGEEEPDD